MTPIHRKGRDRRRPAESWGIWGCNCELRASGQLSEWYIGSLTMGTATIYRIAPDKGAPIAMRMLSAP
jgi:hypothetical protein